jgi:quinol monooxygenase YgiN
MTTPIRIMAILTPRPGKADELKALLQGMVPHCRAEPGNLRWDIWQDRSQADRYVLDELYVNDDAVAAHRETPHFKYYLAGIHDLADRVAFVLEPVEVGTPKP